MEQDNKNKVELIGHYGSDEIIACSAWTSTSRDLTDEKRSRIDKLINMLWKEGHHTPFEKGSVHFLVKTDIASHIHLLKHRIGVSINAESARYKELKGGDFYIPEDWEGKKCSDKELSTKDWDTILDDFILKGDVYYHQCLKDLTPVIGRKRAKETARYFKTYASQIEADVMFNMRSFGHFQKLRNSEHSQVEIREIADQMLTLIEGIQNEPFKHTTQCIRSIL